MVYTAHFALADGSIAHLSGVVPGIVDVDMQRRYAGFVSVIGVAVYELAVKEIFCEFAKRKHRVFGQFIEAHFERLNGRIKIDNLKSEHIRRFGPKYIERFKKLLDQKEKAILTARRRSIIASYSNMIAWRHEFAHEGRPPTNATFQEVCESYELGKAVIECLHQSMVR